MARIRNSSLDNVYDDGKQQILTTDDGKSYTIKNSSLDNVYGEGKQKIIKENSAGGLEEIVPWWVTVIILVVCFMFQRFIS